MIYCIGDSHVSFFSGQNRMVGLWPNNSNDKLKHIKTFRIGPVLANSLSKYNSSVKGREILFTLLDRKVPIENRAIPPESEIMMCFGEIDCRAHIKNQSLEKKIPLSSVIKNTVEKYVNVLSEVQALGYKVNVWNVIPNLGDSFNPDFPSVGTIVERNQIINEFNEILENSCIQNNMNFYSIYKELYAEDFIPDKYYYLDEVHLSQKAMKIMEQKYCKKLNFSRKKTILEIFKG